MFDKDFKDIDRLCTWLIAALVIVGVCMVSNIVIGIYLLCTGGNHG